MTSLASNIWKLRLIRIGMGFVFSTAIMVLFWQSHGLSMAEVMFLQSAFALSMVLFEVPTGFIADRFGHKFSLVLAGLFLALGYGVYGFSTHFSMFLLGEMLLACGFSLYSGAESALLYETLKTLGREDEHTKIFGGNELAFYITAAIAQILGPILVPYIGYSGVILLHVPGMLLAFFTALALIRPPEYQEEEKMNTLESLRFLIKNHFHPSSGLIRILLLGGITHGLNTAILWLYQPYFSYTHVPLEYFGVIFASFQIVAGVGSHFAHTIEKKLAGKNIFLFLQSTIAISYFLMVLFPFPGSFIFAYLQQLVRGCMNPILSTAINAVAPSRFRTTTLSVLGLSNRLFYAMLIPGIGLIVDYAGLMNGILSLGILTSTGVFFLLGEKFLGGKSR